MYTADSIKSKPLTTRIVDILQTW